MKKTVFILNTDPVGCVKDLSDEHYITGFIAEVVGSEQGKILVKLDSDMAQAMQLFAPSINIDPNKPYSVITERAIYRDSMPENEALMTETLLKQCFSIHLEQVMGSLSAKDKARADKIKTRLQPAESISTNKIFDLWLYYVILDGTTLPVNNYVPVVALALSQDSRMPPCDDSRLSLANAAYIDMYSQSILEDVKTQKNAPSLSSAIITSAKLMLQMPSSLSDLQCQAFFERNPRLCSFLITFSPCYANGFLLELELPLAIQLLESNLVAHNEHYLKNFKKQLYAATSPHSSPPAASNNKNYH